MSIRSSWQCRWNFLRAAHFFFIAHTHGRLLLFLFARVSKSQQRCKLTSHRRYGLEHLPCPSVSDTLNLATKRTICERCVPSERGMDMDTILTDPVFADSFSSTGVTAAPNFESTVMSFTLSLTGNVFAVTQTSVQHVLHRLIQQILRHRGAATTMRGGVLLRWKRSFEGLNCSRWDSVSSRRQHGRAQFQFQAAFVNTPEQVSMPSTSADHTQPHFGRDVRRAY